MVGEEGVVTEALGRREQGLKSEGEQDNKELNKSNNENGKGCKKIESREAKKKRICEGNKAPLKPRRNLATRKRKNATLQFGMLVFK